MKNAIILFSGGLDSTTCLAFAKAQGFNCHALSFAYGQKHSVELEAAKEIAASMNINHHIVTLPIDQFSNSALTQTEQAIPDFQGNTIIPATYVPARNTIFLAFALGWAEVLQANDIFIGVSSVDYSGYPDCRPEYIAAFQAMAELATKRSVEGENLRIHAPLLYLSKAATITLGMSLGVNYAHTISCYRTSESRKACGKCDSCMLRKQGFLSAELADPTAYIS